MQWKQRIADVQRHLKEEGFDGWLLYDFQKINPLALEFLALPENQLMSRRFFYWIPVHGEPVKIVHAIETTVLNHLPGTAQVYLRWEEFENRLATLLLGKKKVAMEYSPRGSLPYVSKVDAGLVDLIRSFGVEIASSASFLQYYTCVLDDEQLELHYEAAELLSQIADRTWKHIAQHLRAGSAITEYQVSEFIQDQISAEGFVFEGRPICAVNAHSADPHFCPQKTGSHRIQRGDFILIDLWCKKNQKKGIYGDITRVGFADSEVPEEHLKIFRIVREAQKRATDFVIAKCAKKEYPKGCDVDKACRGVIEEAGYGAYFTHRTGHNIYTKAHGPGAHIDSLETNDFRTLIPRTCFSVEPGIYLPGKFGIRLEYDLVLVDATTVKITGGIQNQIETLL